MRRTASLSAFTAVALALTVALAGAAPAVHAEPAEPERLLVAVSDAGAVSDVAALADHVGAEVTAEVPAAAAVAVEATPAQAAHLAASDNVVAVMPDIPLRPSLAQSGPLVGANTMRAAGFDGSGRAVAVIDSGVQSSHPFLGGRVVDGACFSRGSDCPNGHTTQTGVAGGEPCDFSEDCFHGTHVAGIVAGSNGSFKGIAPAASILSINVATAGDDTCDGDPCLEIWTSDILDAMQQVYDWRDTYEIAAVNMSLGGGLFAGSNCNSYSASTLMKPLIDDLRAVGIPTVVAAGNESSKSKLSWPACISTAVSVGATTKSNAVASYSNDSPALDMWAPGSSITSSAPTSIFNSGYAVASGTSMAAPHVAGAFAVIDELLPSATLSDKQSRIVSTGPVITDRRNGLKHHRLKLSTDVTPPQTTITARPAATTKSSKATFKFTIGTSGAAFSCQVDGGAWKSCAAPRVVRVSAGLHAFRVRGKDAAGNLDPTPATTVWRYRP